MNIERFFLKSKLIKILVFIGLIYLVFIFFRKTNNYSPENSNILQTKSIGSIPNFCHKKRIVFIKTHKTGSSTIFNILVRLAKKKNLTFSCINRFIWPRRFQIKYLVPLNGTYDIFAYHGRFNKPQMHKYFPRNDTFYFTILRDPYTQWSSYFTYFRVYDIFHLYNKNRLRKLLNYFPKNLLRLFIPNFPILHLFRDPNMFDLGYPNDYDNNVKKAKGYIENLATNLDFVMYMEYFNTSLLILQRMLCLDDDDIDYLAMNQSPLNEKDKFDLKNDNSLKKSIYNLNTADHLLYKFFMKPFKRYSSIVNDKLEVYENNLEILYNYCVGERVFKVAYVGRSYYGYEARENLTELEKNACREYMTSELEQTKNICGGSSKG